MLIGVVWVASWCVACCLSCGFCVCCAVGRLVVLVFVAFVLVRVLCSGFLVVLLAGFGAAFLFVVAVRCLGWWSGDHVWA